MPKRDDIKTILLIGSGPIVIGQACEFDYSGVQACQALKEEGYRVVLLNSNPATIMTDLQLADATYVEEMTASNVEQILIREKVDAILSTMGGQTALNLVIQLYQQGILDRHCIDVIGARPEIIPLAENRSIFYQKMRLEKIPCPQGWSISTKREALCLAEDLSFPVMTRSSFALGGKGSVIIHSLEHYQRHIDALFSSSDGELLIEESVLGWKEFEMEVVRDKKDNCIIIGSIENVDPMGIHTGDSIAVSPALTLTDKEYQKMRLLSFAVIRSIGVETGGANVQFAVHPTTGEMVVIEMNPRVSRSSALVSKATGFPIAKVAAKLAVGYTLDELPNEMLGGHSAAFEPTLDYVVTKFPRFDFSKFPSVRPVLTTFMQSIGEVMAIGRTFQESFQKAMRSLEEGPLLLDEEWEAVRTKLSMPHPQRYLYIFQAYRIGFCLQEIAQLTEWDPWFLRQIEELVFMEKELKSASPSTRPFLLRRAKSCGFSNEQLAGCLGLSVQQLYRELTKQHIHPHYHRVDTCAGEFACTTSYLYSTHALFPEPTREVCEADPSDKDKVIVMGSGPNRIGQGIEFDYCCVHAIQSASELGYETIMINCNPETVSTDYNISDKLYLSPLTEEDVAAIIRKEMQRGKIKGVITQLGGQTALKLSPLCQRLSIALLGTDAMQIDRVENRQQCALFLKAQGLCQPRCDFVKSRETLLDAAEQMGYPLIVRPSYVIGGQAMKIVFHADQLKQVNYPQETYPLLIEEFLFNAVEMEVDAICDGRTVYIAGVMEHFESAGVHSGDSTSALPCCSLSSDVEGELASITRRLALALNIVGFVNIQFALFQHRIYVLEINPRASRTIPFLEKSTGVPIASIATQVMLGQPLAFFGLPQQATPSFYAVKKPVFSFESLPGSIAKLGPEMKSTGEVMVIGRTMQEVYNKLFAFQIGKNKEQQIVILAESQDEHTVQQLIRRYSSLPVFFEIHVDLDKAVALIERGKCDLIVQLTSTVRFRNPIFCKTIQRHRILRLSTLHELEGFLRAMEETNSPELIPLQYCTNPTKLLPEQAAESLSLHCV